MGDHKNVLGTPLEICSIEPMTGFTREGNCKVTREDFGVHGVCIQATEEFLEFSKNMGNDLSTPVPISGFFGLQPGDRWCLCASRWKEALEHGAAPLVNLLATHEATLLFVSLEDLLAHSLDNGSA
ncbi:MAG: DUF2237 domain-containing protein [Deltaproteobacteria bacterium]|nr:DUF2237 domain-containing protein [Deltaproteobacteria bacterium]MBW2659693.1 DUF2237 domain-containing protein [Deltaproteobacteria bacterium]